MKTVTGFLRHNLARVVAALVIGALYWATRPPALPMTERAALASQFQFAGSTLPEMPNLPPTPSEVYYLCQDPLAGAAGLCMANSLWN